MNERWKQMTSEGGMSDICEGTMEEQETTGIIGGAVTVGTGHTPTEHILLISRSVF